MCRVCKLVKVTWIKTAQSASVDITQCNITEPLYSRALLLAEVVMEWRVILM
jgi:hypothetical protein